jgi:hypothetical protein
MQDVDPNMMLHVSQSLNQEYFGICAALEGDDDEDGFIFSLEENTIA